MVTRQLRAVVAALALAAVGCGDASGSAEPEALVLHGFRLVDVERRQVVERDVVIENGVVVSRATLARRRTVEGNGRYLLPALWDLKASLWGNNSSQNWDVLTQEANFTQCLGFQLYYGVAHVGVFAMDRRWVQRELKRAEALELAAAEALYPDKILCANAGFACDAVTTADAVRAALDERLRHHVPFVMATYDPENPKIVSLQRKLLAEVLGGAMARHLPALVLVNDWQRATEAVELGASVIYGLPDGLVPEALVELMRQKGAALAPALTGYFELDRLLGNPEALSDPFLAATVRPDIRDSFRHERELWSELRPDLLRARARQQAMLASLARLANAGVHIVSATDAGWSSGAFQGYSSHAQQLWLERAGLDAWARLSAATVWPAALFGRHVDFEPGSAADLIALEADPLASAKNLEKIGWIMRQGRVVDRARLLPDLARSGYRP